LIQKRAASKRTMKTPETTEPLLAQIEAEVMAEGRDWTRKRLETRLQELADTHGEVFPPKPKSADSSARATVSSGHRRRAR
jgi:hypothetical protein